MKRNDSLTGLSDFCKSKVMIQLPTWLTPNERTALQAFVAALREHYDGQVLSVRLFGSKARGDFDADSDLDVMVLVHDDNWRLAQAISFLAADVSWRTMCPFAQSRELDAVGFSEPRRLCHRAECAERRHFPDALKSRGSRIGRDLTCHRFVVT
jgi:hypothetical protein